MSIKKSVMKEYRKFLLETTIKEGHKDKQILWDLKQLYFYCSRCEHRIHVRSFPKGYRTSPSTYLVFYWECLQFHDDFVHNLENGDD